jgi:hypothetical protein
VIFNNDSFCSNFKKRCENDANTLKHYEEYSLEKFALIWKIKFYH